MKKLFSFPHPVNEISARLVAGAVALTCCSILVFRVPVLIVPLAYGFIARVLTGPTLSPLGQLVTRVITPRLGLPPHLVPGPPKRFAQGIGALLSSTAVVFFFAGNLTVVYALVALIIVAATLESVFAFCIGCRIFDLLMRIHVIPQSVCKECASWARA